MDYLLIISIMKADFFILLSLMQLLRNYKSCPSWKVHTKVFRGEWDEACSSLLKENVFKGKRIMCICVYLVYRYRNRCVYLWGREEVFCPC